MARNYKKSFLKKYLGIEKITDTFTYNTGQDHYISRKKQLIQNKQTFLVVNTRNKKTIFHNTNEYIYYLGKEKLKNQQLGLRMQLKKVARKCIKDNFIVVPKTTSKEINYYQISGKILNLKSGECIPVLNCYDINKAYYQAAFNLKYISEEFYQKCIELPKEERLTLIGSLGSQKQWHYFKEGHEEKNWITHDNELRLAWFHICKEVDKTMYNLIQKLGSDFLFYWVDSMYFTDDRHNSMIIDYFKKQGFDVKNETVKNLQREQVFLKSQNKFRESDSVTLEKFNVALQKWEKKEFTIFRKNQNARISDICEDYAL
jgi:hypothetical protein